MPKDFIKAIYEKRSENSKVIEQKFKTRFDIFINNTFYGLIDCLKSVYSVTETLLGKEYFEYIADAYIKTYPMKSADRNKYGAFFADFLVQNLKELDFVIINGRLEWLIFLSGKSKNSNYLTTEEIIENLNNGNDLKLSPSLFLLKSEFNTQEIYAAHLCSKEIVLKQAKEFILIWRDENHEVLIETIDEHIFEFLEVTQKHGLLTALSEKMNNLNQHEFAGLLQKGIFTNE